MSYQEQAQEEMWQAAHPDSPQMFFDRGGDSFLAEIIGIVDWHRLQIDIKDERSRIDQMAYPEGQKVRVTFGCALGGVAGPPVTYIGYGRSYGEALRHVREQLRMELGR